MGTDLLHGTFSRFDDDSKELRYVDVTAHNGGNCRRDVDALALEPV